MRRFSPRRRPPRRRLRVALLAPPWIPIPPPGYGGIELVVAELAGGLVRRGHDVALLAAPGSRSDARVVPLLDREHTDDMGDPRVDAAHAGRARAVIAGAAARGRPFDIVHDHSGFALVEAGDRVDAPVLHTVHGPFDPETSDFYDRHADKVWLSGLSEAQLADAPRAVRCVGAIPNPINVRAWPLARRREPYLLWMGRMTEVKGPHRAIRAARAAHRPLVLAGPVQPGQEAFFATEVEPHIDGRTVCYVEEVGGRRKQRLLARASALLMPIRWAEPFGMVMVEAMACGTPVIAFPEGAAPEVVADGRSGFLVDDEDEMARAVGRLDDIDPARCRRGVAERFDTDAVAGAYESAFRNIIDREREEPAGVSPGAGVPAA